MKINSMRLKPLELHQTSHRSLDQTLKALRTLDHQEFVDKGMLITTVTVNESQNGKAQFQVKEVRPVGWGERRIIVKGIAEVDPARNVTLISGRIVSPNAYRIEMLITFIVGLIILWGVGMNNAGKAPHIIISGYVAVAFIILVIMALAYFEGRKKSLTLLTKIEQAL